MSQSAIPASLALHSHPSVTDSLLQPVGQFDANGSRARSFALLFAEQFCHLRLDRCGPDFIALGAEVEEVRHDVGR